MESASLENKLPDPEGSTEPSIAVQPNSSGEYSPLSIVHLLGWTAGTALIITIWKLHYTEFDGRFLASDLLRILRAMLYGAGVAALARCLIIRFRGQRSYMSPGEWFLVALAGGELLRDALYFAVTSFSKPNSDTDVFAFGLGSTLASTVPYILALLYGGGGINWRAMFVLLAVFQAMDLIPLAFHALFGPLWFETAANAMRWIYGPKPFVWLALAIAVVSIDVTRGMHRGWIHNVGAAVLILLPCLDIAQRFLWAFFRLI